MVRHRYDWTWNRVRLEFTFALPYAQFSELSGELFSIGLHRYIQIMNTGIVTLCIQRAATMLTGEGLFLFN